MKDFEEYKRKMAQHEQSWTDMLPPGWVASYRDDRGFWEAIKDGVGHPHPDDPRADPVHGCDGQCSQLDYIDWKKVSDV